MSLDLDERQRAMLAEMGVPVWWPQARPQDAPVATAGPRNNPHVAIDTKAAKAYTESVPGIKPTNASAPVAMPPGPVATDIASMDWPALRANVASCQACTMGLGRRAPVLLAPPTGVRADWLVLGDPPDDAQERAGQPFADAAGQLLDNMLKAVGVRRCQSRPLADAAVLEPAGSAYLSLVLKCRPALPTTPDAGALAACGAYLRREIALIEPKVILSMGRLAMQLLLSQDHPQGLTLPLGKLRGRLWHYQGVPVVVTYPPAYLLRNGQDKARAWEDLCLAADVAQGVFTAA